MRNLFTAKYQDSFGDLYDQTTFFNKFLRDLGNAHSEVIIESPFITTARMSKLLPVLAKTRQRSVRIIINTRNPDDHEGTYRRQALDAIYDMQSLGIKVVYTVGHHRKIAIIDSHILWEGSLNILSFSDSAEVMRRVNSSEAAMQMRNFIKLDKFMR